MLAHQNWSQADDRLRGALQNAGLEFIFKSGRMDAEYSAKLLGWVNPMSIKHRVRNDLGGERMHPTYFPLQEQWERYVQQIQYLKTGHAFVRLPNDWVHKVKIKRLPHLKVGRGEIEAVKEEYLRKYFGQAKEERPKTKPITGPSELEVIRTPVATQADVFSAGGIITNGQVGGPGRSSGKPPRRNG